jgi:hypothetical protein
MRRGRNLARLARLALLVGLIAAVVVATAAAGPAKCTHGVSSVGPVVVSHGQLDRQQSDLMPHTQACLPAGRPAPR